MSRKTIFTSLFLLIWAGCTTTRSTGVTTPATASKLANSSIDQSVQANGAAPAPVTSTELEQKPLVSSTKVSSEAIAQIEYSPRALSPQHTEIRRNNAAERRKEQNLRSFESSESAPIPADRASNYEEIKIDFQPIYIDPKWRKNGSSVELAGAEKTASAAVSEGLISGKPLTGTHSFLVHYTSGLSQPADDVRDVDPYYEITYGKRSFQVPKDLVKEIVKREQKAALPPRVNSASTTPTPPAPVQAQSHVVPAPPTENILNEQSIDAVFLDGACIILDDATVWEVDSGDTSDTSQWQSSSEVFIKETSYKGYTFHEMINTDESEKASVTFLGTVALRTSIQGDFEGWDGDTVFTLLNGQVLEQAEYSYTYHYAYMPEVVLVDIGMQGVYTMIVEGVDEMIRVRVLR